jgi:hypothetical protein
VRSIHAKVVKFALVALTLPLLALAADEGTVELRQELEQLRQRSLEQDRLIQKLEARLQELELAQQRGRGVTQGESAPVAQPVQDAPAGASAQGAAGGATPPARSAIIEQITQQEHAPLFERQFTLETGITYARFDRRFLSLSGFLALDAIFLGQINLQQTRSDAFTFDLTGRYGLTDRLSVDLNLPWLYRRNAFIEGGANGTASSSSQAIVSAGDIGDVNAGLYYQLWRETDKLPDIVGSMRVRSPTGREPYGIKFTNPDPNNSNLTVPDTLPTGTGVWTTQLGLSLLKTSDPLVLFANVGYNYNFDRHFEDISPTANVQQPGKVSLGNSWQWGAGFAVAFNERASVSFSLSHQIGMATRVRSDGQPWQTVVGSDYSAATFQTGLTYQLSDALFMIGSVGIGVTPDAPDFTVGVKFPYRF